mmetsp:Transcript_32920/g.39451  ORF Transcript_32920/g.39451 Transcript_32920/m.39451 type:complete len:240 (+) Transcript_32920:75-794(+)
MSSEPRDEIVKAEIISTIDKMDTVSIRPNKLRKVICKKVDGTNWTQYQRVLDSILEEKILKTKAVDGELMILPSRANCQSQTENLEEKNSSDVKKKTEVMSVPLAIIRHLVKKGHQKQNNIEKNSKSKIRFSKESMVAIRTKDFNPADQAELTITKYYGDDEELATKQLKNALLMVNKMVKAYNDSPDHFHQTDAGGTLKHQEEVKKRKFEAEKKRGRKTKNEENSESTIGKKRNRKYY